MKRQMDRSEREWTTEVEDGMESNGACTEVDYYGVWVIYGGLGLPRCWCMIMCPHLSDDSLPLKRNSLRLLSVSMGRIYLSSEGGLPYDYVFTKKLDNELDCCVLFAHFSLRWRLRWLLCQVLG